MRKVEELQSEIGKLSPREMQELRDWLENVLEDQLKLRKEFKAKIEQSEQDWLRGHYNGTPRLWRPFRAEVFEYT